ncbi:hypothetical protein HO173_010021 [Letharia columbiana]|uniref:Uncharacterized protein n=1 Tax=Letharia columbiana TaxID=112416 RepID=A0A8H6L168_9LECA|nr:uncharacterized protein HO173_010021 [Letharia columbiana]KAF6231719.1 hypothetical protein HO173_010021 [Letharia columbiana]
MSSALSVGWALSWCDGFPLESALGAFLTHDRPSRIYISISPSVYVAYHGLNAHYDCGYFSSFTTGAIYDTTIAYPSDALSTYVGPLWMQAQTGPEPASLFQAINYTEFQEYEANTANEGYSKNLKIPSDLGGIDPAWSTCTPGMYGSWDPPRVLTAARNMVAPTPAQPDLDPSATAAPAAGIAPTHIPASPTPPPKGSANGPLQTNPPTASADLVSESKETQSDGNNDPAWSVGQAENASKGGNVGESPTPAPKPSQDSGPVDQQDNSQKSPPNQSSHGASNNSPHGGGSGGDNNNNNNKAGAPSLNFDPQDSSHSPQSSLRVAELPLPIISVVLASPTPLIVGGSTIEKALNGGAAIGKSTYTAGYEGQIANMPISVGVDKIVIGSSTHALPTSTPVLVGGQLMVKAANGGVIIGTSTYPPGSQAQISGKVLSVGSDSVVVGGTSYAIPTPGTADTVFIDSQSVSRAPNGGAIFKSGAISLGSQSDIDGHAISVGSSTIVVDGTSYALPSSAGAILQSPRPQSNVPITLTNGVILTPGGNAATISGTTYAIPSDDSVLVVDGQLVPFPTQTALQSVFTVGGQIFTAAPTGFAIGGQSVTLDGTAATLDGTVVSLGPSGVQVGSKTIPLTSAQTTEAGLGGLIMSAFGSGGEPGATVGAGNGSSVVAFTGGSSRVERRLGIVLLGLWVWSWEPLHY